MYHRRTDCLSGFELECPALRTDMRQAYSQTLLHKSLFFWWLDWDLNPDWLSSNNMNCRAPETVMRIHYYSRKIMIKAQLWKDLDRDSPVPDVHVASSGCSSPLLHQHHTSVGQIYYTAYCFHSRRYLLYKLTVNTRKKRLFITSGPIISVYLVQSLWSFHIGTASQSAYLVIFEQVSWVYGYN